MRIRIVISGIVSGVFCLITLWFPWYLAYPAEVAVSDWTFLREAQNFPVWLSTVIPIFCALTVFALGWVSARWNWSKTWRSSLLAGAGSGLIAGCLVYDFIGAFHYGLLGQAEILKTFYVDVGETQGLTLLLEGIIDSASLLYMNFIVVVFASVLVGALGGLASAIDLDDVWGSPPREPDEWLFRLPAYVLPLTGYGCTVVVVAVFSLLQETVINAAIENALIGMKAFPILLSTSAYLTCIAMLFAPVGLTWGWIICAWKSAGLWRIPYGVWLTLTLYFVSWMVRGLFNFNEVALVTVLGGPYLFALIWGVTLGSLAIGFVTGLASAPAVASGGKYRPSDWLGYALSMGILGGTQVFISLPAYALIVAMVTIENIPHLLRTGLVQYSPAQQIIRLFDVMTVSAQVSIVTCGIGGWFLALFVFLIRKFLKIRPPELPQESNPITPLT